MESKFYLEIQRLRKLKNMTQADMAAILDMLPGTYSYKERNANFANTELAKIAKALGVLKDDLITLAQEGSTTIADSIDFLVKSSMRHESMLSALLSGFAEMLAIERNKSLPRKQWITKGDVLRELTTAVNRLSKDQLDGRG